MTGDALRWTIATGLATLELMAKGAHDGCLFCMSFLAGLALREDKADTLDTPTRDAANQHLLTDRRHR